MPHPTSFDSNRQLADWLDANTWLEAAEVSALVPAPGAEPTDPAEITVRLTETLRGTYEAGSERVVREVELHALGVRNTTLRRGLTFHPGHCCEGLDLLDAATGVALRIDLPGALEIRCARLARIVHQVGSAIEP